MKISKKTIIIIIIVVAVAAWLLWKRKKETEAVAQVASPSTPDRLEELIAAAGLTSLEAELVRKFNPTGAYKDWIIQDALSKGLDLESAYLLNCLWNYYRNKENTAFQSEAFSTRYKTIYNKVKAMN